MAAVLGADDEAVVEACEAAGGDVWVANSNAGGQVVIAGDPAAIEKATALAKERGARKVLPLPVGGAFHTPFMAPAAERLRAALARTTFADASVPVIANVDALPHQHADQWADLLDQQLTSPVRWRESVERMVADGIKGTRAFLTDLYEAVKGHVAAGRSLRETFERVHETLKPAYGDWVIFEHCLPFNVTRAYDEAGGLDHPRIWTDERDRQMWLDLRG